MPKAPIRVPEPPPRVQLSRTTVSYIEARLDGVAPAQCLQRYGPEYCKAAEERAEREGLSLSDALRREVRLLDAQISQVLALEARRMGLFGSARAFRMLPRIDDDDFDTLKLQELGVALPAPQKGLPTLEQLAERFPDFGEAELIEHLQELQRERQEAVPPAPAMPARRIVVRPTRRQRIVRLQRRSLERLMSPRLVGHQDHLHALLPPPMANRLHAHGIVVVHDLMVAVSKSSQWYAPIAGFGKAKAAVLEQWLRAMGLMPRREPPRLAEQATAALASLPPPADTARQAPGAALPFPAQAAASAGALAPSLALEQLDADPALDGSRGTLRVFGGTPMLPGVNTDAAAILAWLQTVKRSRHTWRAYRREAVRLLLWCRLVRGVAMSSLSAADCAAYIEFLTDIPEEWRTAGAPGNPRLGEFGWVPFDSDKLSEESIAYTYSVVNRLFRWLNDARYLSGNPWRLLPADLRKRATRQMKAGERSFSVNLVEDVMRELEKPPCTPREAKWLPQRRVLLALLFDAGLRREEVARARYGDVQVSQLGSAVAGAVTDYTLHVLGKGRRERDVPISDRLHRWMVEDLQARGLPGDLRAPENAARCVLFAARSTERLHADSVYKRVEAALEWLARRFEETGRVHDATRLREGSTHWGRHSFAMRTAKSAPLHVVQSLLGHRNLQTTLTYAQVTDDERFAAVAANAPALQAGSHRAAGDLQP